MKKRKKEIIEKEKITKEQIDSLEFISEQHKQILYFYYIENLRLSDIVYEMNMPIYNVKYIINHFTKNILEKT